jgi:hypothetical protein
MGGASLISWAYKNLQLGRRGLVAEVRTRENNKVINHPET